MAGLALALRDTDDRTIAHSVTKQPHQCRRLQQQQQQQKGGMVEPY